ncbi:MAG TPA: hypothetical protein VFW33_20850, partial [Gemmataceae bacterium]|nr:hypothetical protein [Gemmataceae bacterium]
MEVVSSWTFMMIMAFAGGTGFPLGVPPLPEDPALAKIAPEECLLYFSSAGMAKPDMKSTNQTEKLFAEPEVQRLASGVEQMIRAGLKASAEKGGPEAKAHAEDGAELAKVLLTRPVAVYLGQLKVEPKEAYRIRAGAVVSLGDDADAAKAALERLLSTAKDLKSKDVTVEGATFHRLTFPGNAPEVTWGVKDKYLYVAAGD